MYGLTALRGLGDLLSIAMAVRRDMVNAFLSKKHYFNIKKVL